MPVLTVGGKGALGQAIPDQAQLYADDVTGAVLRCGLGAEESRNSCSSSCCHSSASPASTTHYAVIKL